MGVILCARPGCREQHEFELQTPYAPPDTAFRELLSHPLPADWVKLKYMLYPEGDKDNPDFFEFHNPHCAALYLDSLPAAKGNQDIRRVRT